MLADHRSDCLLNAMSSVSLHSAYCSNNDLIVQFKESALHRAALNGHAKAAKLLLRAKADCLQLDKVRLRCMFCAADWGVQDKCTPLHHAAKLGHAKVVKALLINKSNINAKNTVPAHGPLNHLLY